jgi:hypothetical protein
MQPKPQQLAFSFRIPLNIFIGDGTNLRHYQALDLNFFSAPIWALSYRLAPNSQPQRFYLKVPVKAS